MRKFWPAVIAFPFLTVALAAHPQQPPPTTTAPQGQAQAGQAAGAVALKHRSSAKPQPKRPTIAKPHWCVRFPRATVCGSRR